MWGCDLFLPCTPSPPPLFLYNSCRMESLISKKNDLPEKGRDLNTALRFAAFQLIILMSTGILQIC